MFARSRDNNEQISYGEKRSSRRISARIDARLFHSNTFHSGTVLNLSDYGMFIKTDRCVPHDSIFVVIIRDDNHLMKLIAKVKYVMENHDTYSGMGVELLDPFSQYANFLDRLCAHLQ